MEKTLLSILISLTLASASTIVKEKSLLEGYGVQDVNDYQESGWGEVMLWNDDLMNAKLQWKVSDNYVKFNLTLDPIIKTNCSSYRVGFSNPANRNYQGHYYDYAVINFKPKIQLKHMNKISNPNDIEENAYYGFKEITNSTENGNLWITWKRHLNIITDETVMFLKGSNYSVIYGCANVYDYSQSMRIKSITLSNEFSKVGFEPSFYNRNLGYEDLETVDLYWKVNSDYNGEGDVSFHLIIHPSMIDEYDWYQIGLREPFSEFSTSYADYNVVLLKDKKIILMNTFDGSETPKNNTVDNTIIPLAWGPTVDGNVSVIWDRELKEASNETIRIMNDYQYTLIYAYGKSSGGSMEYSGKGHRTIELRNSFSPPHPDDSALSVCSLLGLLAIQLII